MDDERNKTLEELYSNYYDSVYRFCMTVTGFDRRYYHLIEDCVQDAFIAAILKYDDFKHAALMDAIGDDDADEVEEIGVPSESPDTTIPTQVVIVSNGGKVNIRYGNNTTYGRISLVSPGTTYPYVATAANGWHAVVIGSKVGWVSGEYSKTI